MIHNAHFPGPTWTAYGVSDDRGALVPTIDNLESNADEQLVIPITIQADDGQGKDSSEIIIERSEQHRRWMLRHGSACYATPFLDTAPAWRVVRHLARQTDAPLTVVVL